MQETSLPPARCGSASDLDTIKHPSLLRSTLTCWQPGLGCAGNSGFDSLGHQGKAQEGPRRQPKWMWTWDTYSHPSSPPACSAWAAALCSRRSWIAALQERCTESRRRDYCSSRNAREKEETHVLCHLGAASFPKHPCPRAGSFLPSLGCPTRSRGLGKPP